MKTEYINGGPQFTITEAGRSAMTKQDDASIGAMIEAGSQMGAVQKGARAHAEMAAKCISECAKSSAQMTGDTPETAARKWSPIILERALDIINGG